MPRFNIEPKRKKGFGEREGDFFFLFSFFSEFYGELGHFVFFSRIRHSLNDRNNIGRAVVGEMSDNLPSVQFFSF